MKRCACELIAAFLRFQWHVKVGTLSALFKEALFQLELSQATGAAKRCTGLVGQEGGVLGEEVLTREEVEAAKEEAAAALKQHQQELEEAATHRQAALGLSLVTLFTNSLEPCG